MLVYSGCWNIVTFNIAGLFYANVFFNNKFDLTFTTQTGKAQEKDAIELAKDIIREWRKTGQWRAR